MKQFMKTHYKGLELSNCKFVQSIRKEVAKEIFKELEEHKTYSHPKIDNKDGIICWADLMNLKKRYIKDKGEKYERNNKRK